MQKPVSKGKRMATMGIGVPTLPLVAIKARE